MSKRALLLTAFFVGLFFLHQDSWWAGDATLVLGVLPVSLAYHVGWTLAVALGWWLVAKYCWPDKLDDDEPAAPRAPTNPADEKRP
ncbi:MAG: hypothetical protein HZA93_11125 [Verrucomicrobia bacterium]|nr:hypothetical protein [Verrucomicrobiota bacterium]